MQDTLEIRALPVSYGGTNCKRIRAMYFCEGGRGGLWVTLHEMLDRSVLSRRPRLGTMYFSDGITGRYFGGASRTALADVLSRRLPKAPHVFGAAEREIEGVYF
jgi:hypothetical protein